MEERESISLVNLYGGGAVEMFDRALQEVLKNILDENTTLKQRKVQLTLTVTPDEKRTHIDIDMEVTRTIEGQGKVKIKAGLEIDEQGRAVAIDYDQFQRKIVFGPKTVPIRGKES